MDFDDSLFLDNIKLMATKYNSILKKQDNLSYEMNPNSFEKELKIRSIYPTKMIDLPKLKKQLQISSTENNCESNLKFKKMSQNKNKKTVFAVFFVYAIYKRIL